MLGTCLAGTKWQPVEESPARDIRTFRPSANGFAFVNRFTGSPIPFSLGGLENKLGTPSAFGLCGGMSFAAADFFLAHRTPPARATPPSKRDGRALFDFIQQRQMATFGPQMRLAARFGRWMSLPDVGPFGTRTMTIAELDDIRAGLSAGQPIVLGLVFNHHGANKEASGPAGVAWENHQVLAYDMAPSPRSRGTASIRIYDPNYPGRDDVRIVCRVRVAGMAMVGPWGGVQVPVLGVECERVIGEVGGKGAREPTRVRGLFVMPYMAARLPEKVEE